MLSPTTTLTGSPHIPQDVLVHIFSFLDMRSLVAASLVCWYFFLPVSLHFFRTCGTFVHHTFFFPRRSWNSAAVDNNLWRMNYSLFFGACNVNDISRPVSGVQNIYGLAMQNTTTDSVSVDPNFCWKELFHNKYAGNCVIPLVASTLKQTTTISKVVLLTVVE